MVTYQPDGRNRQTRRLADEARQLAVAGKWDEARELNQRILSDHPRDVDAFNRLGKALNERGQFQEALDAYRSAAEVDPGNVIALRNISRLEQIVATEVGPRVPSAGIEAGAFIEEVGKTYMTDLVHPGPSSVICLLAPGDEVILRPEQDQVHVLDRADRFIGMLEPRVARTLNQLLKHGNRYQAFVVALTANTVRVIVREVLRNPETPPALVLPPQAKIPAPRPYLRDMGGLRRDLEPDLLLDGDEDDEDEDTGDEADVEDPDLADDADDDPYIETAEADEEEEEEEESLP